MRVEAAYTEEISIDSVAGFGRDQETVIVKLVSLEIREPGERSCSHSREICPTDCVTKWHIAVHGVFAFVRVQLFVWVVNQILC